MIRKEIQLILDSLPDEELKKIYWTAEAVQKDYLYRRNLAEKGVIISDIYDGDTEIIDRWDMIFTQTIDEEIKAKIHYNQFRWHVFSYNILDCFKEEAARNAFNTVMKKDLYVIYQNFPSVFLLSNASSVTADDFDSQQDIYIFDKNHTWTYINTHEEMCGPYFFKVK